MSVIVIQRVTSRGPVSRIHSLITYKHAFRQSEFTSEQCWQGANNLLYTRYWPQNKCIYIETTELNTMPPSRMAASREIRKILIILRRFYFILLQHYMGLGSHGNPTRNLLIGDTVFQVLRHVHILNYSSMRRIQNIIKKS